MDMSSDAALNSQDTLSLSGGSIMESSGLYKLDGSDWVDKYSSYHSSDGKIWAAVYAYMDQPSTYEYSVKGGVCSCGSVVALESVEATDVTNILLGGFAYNQKDYAAVQVWSLDDSEIDAINYRNDLLPATKRSERPKNSMPRARTWAQRPGLTEEIKIELISKLISFSKL
jgi:hypothetical protein